MSRRNRRQPKNNLDQREEVRRLVEAEVNRRMAQMPPLALPASPTPQPLNQDALMQTMLAQQAPAKHGTPMFSPGAPLAPQPGLVLPSGPRGFAYTTGYNIYSQPRSTEATSFETLRNLAALYDGIQLCEQVWLDAVAKLTLKIKVRDEVIAEQGSSAHLMAAYADRIRRYTDFFEFPDPGNGYDVKSWLRAAVRDQLQIDALAIYLRKNRAGGLYALELVDGATIKPLIDPRGRRPVPPFPAYEQFVYGVPAGLYTSDEMLYLRETTRTESVYGLSRVERIILRINQALRKENKDLSRFTDGNVPPGILTPPDDGSQWTPEMLLAYQEMWDALLAGNDQARSRIKVIQPGSSLTPLQEPDIFVDFDRFLLNVTAACYSMTMADLGFTENVNKSSAESQQNVFYRRAVAPLIDRYAWLFTYILRRYFDERDLIVTFGGFEEAEDFQAMASTYVALTQAGITSPDVAAHKLNLPWSGPSIPNYVVTKEGVTFLEDAANPQIRKAANEAKIAGFELAANPPPGTPPNGTENESHSQIAAQNGTAAQNPGGGTKKPSRDDDTTAQRVDRPDVVQHHSGVMVAFLLDDVTAKHLALPGGEPPEQLHVTLAFLGDINDDPPGAKHPVTQLAELQAVLAGFAATAQPLSGSVGGLARFAPSQASNHTSPLVALVNAPGLQDFQRTLTASLVGAGFSIDNTFDYVPHITLAYLESSAPLPVNTVPTLPLLFSTLTLCVGDDRYAFPLHGNEAQRGATRRDESGASAAFFRGNHAKRWQPPGDAQLALEAALAAALHRYLMTIQAQRDGTLTYPAPAATEELAMTITTLLQRLHDSAYEAAKQPARAPRAERGLFGTIWNAATRAAAVVAAIPTQAANAAARLRASTPPSGEQNGEAEAWATWAEQYSSEIAATEGQGAWLAGQLQAFQEDGYNGVEWIADPNACSVCRANADEGPLAIGVEFSSGDTAPPAHPHCRCTLNPV